MAPTARYPAPAPERIRLTPGRHDSPREGACVVELASLIAGEEFSDRPRCVCPVIGAFLRAWNDRAAYAYRQRLRPYAERVIGSRAPAAIARQRRDICLEWVGADLRHGRLRNAASRAAMRLRIAALIGIPEALRLEEGAPEYAARLLIGRRDVGGAFLLLDAMLAIGHAAADGGTVFKPPEPVDVNGADANGYEAETNGNGRVPTSNGNGRASAASGNGRAPAENGSAPASTGNGNAPTPSAKPTSSSRSD